MQDANSAALVPFDEDKVLDMVKGLCCVYFTWMSTHGYIVGFFSESQCQIRIEYSCDIVVVMGVACGWVEHFQQFEMLLCTKEMAEAE